MPTESPTPPPREPAPPPKTPLAAKTPDYPPIEVDAMCAATRKQETDIRYKLLAGEQLSDEETEFWRAYKRRYAKKQVTLYIPAKHDADLVEQAARSGQSLSALVQRLVNKALVGDDERVAGLKSENGSLRDEVRVLRSQNVDLGVEKQELLRRLEALEGGLMEALDQTIELARARE